MSQTSGPVQTDSMVRIDRIGHSRIERRDEVVALTERAQRYLRSMSWCKEIVQGWLDFACGYVIGVFYFQIMPAKSAVPQFVWIIVGDIPPAYMDVEYCRSGTEALEGYVAEMQEWVDRVLGGLPIDDDVIPVNVPPEECWAKTLQSRLDSIRELFLEDTEQTPL